MRIILNTPTLSHLLGSSLLFRRNSFTNANGQRFLVSEQLLNIFSYPIPSLSVTSINLAGILFSNFQTILIGLSP